MTRDTQRNEKRVPLFQRAKSMPAILVIFLTYLGGGLALGISQVLASAQGHFWQGTAIFLNISAFILGSWLVIRHSRPALNALENYLPSLAVNAGAVVVGVILTFLYIFWLGFVSVLLMNAGMSSL